MGIWNLFRYRTVHLDINEKKQVQELIKRLASEERIGIEEDVYEDVVIENYGIPVVITDVLVRKHKSTGRNIYINHPDSIHKIERKNTVAATAKRA